MRPHPHLVDGQGHHHAEPEAGAGDGQGPRRAVRLGGRVVVDHAGEAGHYCHGPAADEVPRRRFELARHDEPRDAAAALVALK